MSHTYIGTPNIITYNTVAQKLRAFFLAKGFVEVHTQDRLSILAACEDPYTVATFTYAGEVWPLPQTGQMWLEYELLTRPDIAGVFCMSTSYRQEPTPVPGRHNIIFPMFEFESHGTIAELRTLEQELLSYLGFGEKDSFAHIAYLDAANTYGVEELTHDHEKQLCETHGDATFLEYFPEYTSPFWNMCRSGETANKIDVLLCGMETIGSAERSLDKTDMRQRFHEISNGGYAEKLYKLFGKERVERELEEFLALPMIPRFGGGIGMTRLMRAMQLRNII